MYNMKPYCRQANFRLYKTKPCFKHAHLSETKLCSRHANFPLYNIKACNRYASFPSIQNQTLF